MTGTDPWESARERMVATQIAARGVGDEQVLAAMRRVPRHLFVPAEVRGSAYSDYPLPIGHGQTISQPYIVAMMTSLLQIQPDDHLLEIGSGSGYQAAVLGILAREVISIERIPEVAQLARKNLADAGITNVTVVIGDGTLGFPGGAPYDGVLITAATPSIPSPLVEQLAEGGRLVAPVGSRDLQELVRLTRKGHDLTRESFGGVVFVPLLGEHGWK
ncbi:MAG: protein-L-isoaspartate(D-aspartate) O-methyltransferase [Methanomicrobiales archaeon]|jgi:protein-L-isoaspartate(D-aspartate) O-methyltransferase|nr:protein-L-isoaspartate(D-aspartate) O-methyltransferase [Burkholderiaceae bacterium]NLH26496.1 protein-L-isoaspartate(D-aspartate) O-methyltransferase [Methanomicrobiales archaeon]HNL85683.1 protein-L-isoaspartate(D-aspartate) O-methyltransferase [Methanoregulaceae archaeon]HNO08905.1 protein-L-isoaspartate(D-aspartate) O-methyltransferase [Methanoregulaceae archaeon]HNW79954.1 protein-L-isoaspartate(D-aspartate) O-methyltransferase [Methanoregulaceae archaeon]